MDKNDSTASLDLVNDHDENTVSMSNFRCCIGIEAVVEIDQLCDLLRKVGSDPADAGLAIRGVAARIQELAHIAMVVLCDPKEASADLSYHLRGDT